MAGLKMAKAPEDEWQRVMDFVNELDAKSEDFQISDADLGKWVRKNTPPMTRVVYGYRVLVDNTCDPKATTLEFNERLQRAFAALAKEENERLPDQTPDDGRA